MYGGRKEWDLQSLAVLFALFCIFGYHKTFDAVNSLIGSVIPGVNILDEDDKPTLFGMTVNGVLMVIVWELVNQRILTQN